MKFAHLSDCHLGSWRLESLQKTNFQSFQKAVEISLRENVDFMLIAGDLFDSAYPPIEILKETFAEFRKIRDAQIPVFLIAGSHDFSASGKTFLDILESAGFCKIVSQHEIQPDGRIKLIPYIFKDIAIFGYPGKKSSAEIESLKKTYFDSIYPFTIFMFHTTIKDVVGNIPMEYLETSKLPIADYYAMGHIHKRFEKKEGASVFVYPGPIFPCNFSELADLKHGSFNIVELDNGKIKTKNVPLQIKDVVYLEVEIDNGLTATEKIIRELDKISLYDRIVLLKISGTLLQGKTGDINFEEIEKFVEKKQSFAFLRNASSIKTEEPEINVEVGNVENVEEVVIKQYSTNFPHDLNSLIPQLITAMSIEKNEDEKEVIYENRLMAELNKILGLEI